MRKLVERSQQVRILIVIFASNPLILHKVFCISMILIELNPEVQYLTVL